MNPLERSTQLLLRLYVVAGAPNSTAARANLGAILADLAKDSFSLEVVDCIAHPHRALAEGVFVTPTLLKLSPEPSQTIVGSLKDRASVIAALGLAPQAEGVAS